MPEKSIVLADGKVIASGWIDTDDPDALQAGDYLRVDSADGDELLYVDTADLVADPVAARKLINAIFDVCSGA